MMKVQLAACRVDRMKMKTKTAHLRYDQLTAVEVSKTFEK